MHATYIYIYIYIYIWSPFFVFKTNISYLITVEMPWYMCLVLSRHKFSTLKTDFPWILVEIDIWLLKLWIRNMPHGFYKSICRYVRFHKLCQFTKMDHCTMEHCYLTPGHGTISGRVPRCNGTWQYCLPGALSIKSPSRRNKPTDWNGE